MAHVSLQCQFLASMLMTLRTNKTNTVARACFCVRVCLCACVCVCYLIPAQGPRKHIFTILPYLHILKGSKLKPEHVCKRILYRGTAVLYAYIFLCVP